LSGISIYPIIARLLQPGQTNLTFFLAVRPLGGSLK
jgi:hypothetical protein